MDPSAVLGLVPGTGLVILQFGEPGLAFSADSQPGCAYGSAGIVVVGARATVVVVDAKGPVVEDDDSVVGDAPVQAAKRENVTPRRSCRLIILMGPLSTIATESCCGRNPMVLRWLQSLERLKRKQRTLFP